MGTRPTSFYNLSKIPKVKIGSKMTVQLPLGQPTSYFPEKSIFRASLLSLRCQKTGDGRSTHSVISFGLRRIEEEDFHCTSYNPDRNIT